MIVWTRSVYLDHNATTPPAPEVRRAMKRAMKRLWGNASSLHTQGRAARGAIEQARREVAALLGEADPDRILFTSGGTEGNNAVLKGVFLARGGRGHVVTTMIEHESVLGACKQIESMGGEVTRLAAGPDGRVTVEDVVAALRPDTVLVSVMHGNNETGAVQPVAAIARACAERGVPVHTDAVQTVGKIPFRVAELGCAFLTMSAHKINGPKGAGAIWCRGDVPFTPLVGGGDQERGLRAGTEGVAQLVGFGEAARLARARVDGEAARLGALRARLITGLRRLAPDVIVHEAPAEAQLPGTVNVAFPGREGVRLLAGLDCWGVAVSIGSACTADRIEPSHVLLGMGVPVDEALSSIRMSLGVSTSARDIDYALAVLGEILAGDPHGFAYLDPAHLTEERIDSPQSFLIDLRFPHERLLAPSIRGAREWSSFTIDRHRREIPRDREIILMCGTGIISLAAGYRLAKDGYPSVRVLYGGVEAWRALNPSLAARVCGRAGRGQERER